MNKIKNCASKIKEIYPWIILAVMYLSTLLFLYKYVDTYVDSDMAAEMIYAKMLNERNAIMTSDFFASTGPRIGGCYQFFRIGLLLFPNSWRLARLVGSAIMLALLVLMNIVISRKISCKNVAVSFTILTIAPFGTWYMFHVLFGYIYTMKLIYILFFLYLYMLYCENGKKVHGILIVGISVLFGMNGIVYAEYIIIPLVMANVMELIYSRGIEDGDSKNDMNIRRRVIALVLSVGAFAIGYIYYSAVLVKNYSFETYDNVFFNTLNPYVFLEKLADYFAMFGYPYDAFLRAVTDGVPLSSRYILLVFFGLIAALLVFISTIFALTKFKLLTKNERFILEFYISSVIGLTVVMSLATVSDYSYYWISVIPTTFLVMQIAWNHSKFKLFSQKEAIIAIAVTVVTLGIFTCMRFLETPVRAIPELKEIENCLELYDAKQIYSTFWNGAAITEMSNGKIDAYVVDEFETFKMHEWLQEKSHLIRPEGIIYIVLLKDEVPERNVHNYEWFDDDNMKFIYGDGNTDYWVIMADADRLL